MSGPYGNRGKQWISRTNDSEWCVVLANLFCTYLTDLLSQPLKKIQSIANILRLSEVVCLATTRMYTLVVEHKFTKGRKSMKVVAVCLYVACRQKETRNYMLVDFSDLQQVCKSFSFIFDFLAPFHLLFQEGQRFRTWSHYVSPARLNP